MAQNDMDTDGADTTTDDSQKTTEEDLRNLKYGDGEVETGDDESSEDDTTGSDDSDNDSDASGEDEGKTSDQASDEDSEDDASQFVKELPNIKGDTVVDYARNLESTIIESNKEGKRLADENAALKARLASDGSDTNQADTSAAADGAKVDVNDPVALYVKQQMDRDIANAFSAFQKDYPQAVPGTPEYAAFTNEVAIFSKTIMESQGRIPDFGELYNKAAISLGWDKGSSPTEKEKIDMAMKSQSAVTKTTSSTKAATKSKVTAEMIALNKKMYPDKSEEQIRKELEPHIK